jgi:hypothetical protein
MAHPSIPPSKRQPAAPNRRVSRPPRDAPKPASGSRRSTAFGAALGIVIGAAGVAAFTWGKGTPPPGPSAEPESDPLAGLPDPPPAPNDSNEPVVEEPDLPKKTDEPEKPWDGPWLGALALETPVYPTARFSRNRLGYLRHGAKAPVINKPLRTESCKQGFYPLVDGGYVCGKYATVNVDDPRVKAGVRAPDLDGLLPYKYAYNKAHGTPLYSEIPSREDMEKYEPYLAAEKNDKKKKSSEEAAPADIERADQPRPDEGQFLKNGSLALPESGAGGGAAAPETPWWQKEKGQELNVKLSDLEESDGMLARRMVKGFFIAIDRTFGWNDRLWYKNTTGFVAPADRMIIPKTPEMRGFEMKGDVKQVGFILAPQSYKYELAKDGVALRRAGRIERFYAIGLSGKTMLFDKERYRETSAGWWMRERENTWTEPGPRPTEARRDEKWIDVNLSKKTLVAFEGDDPVYAALVAPGKRSKNKKKDHRTRTGMWRIREKHITATMDGDGVAGDLPYSIDDVPFVQYYEGSYALHGAFWHQNFGREQSHGCVNLAPYDAKYMFFWSEPKLPRGWHGVWASDKRKGSLVVVHE